MDGADGYGVRCTEYDVRVFTVRKWGWHAELGRTQRNCTAIFAVYLYSIVFLRGICVIRGQKTHAEVGMTQRNCNAIIAVYLYSIVFLRVIPQPFGGAGVSIRGEKNSRRVGRTQRDCDAIFAVYLYSIVFLRVNLCSFVAKNLRRFGEGLKRLRSNYLYSIVFFVLFPSHSAGQACYSWLPSHFPNSSSTFLYR
jgi:hypothetical protein